MNMKKNVALVLEGGGARGAYHIGVVKALLEEGYSFDGIFGTSIGSINAAVIAQGDFEIAEKLWGEITTSTLFDIEESEVEKLLTYNFDRDFLNYVYQTFVNAFDSKGVDTTKARGFLDTYIKEDKVRASGKNFGLATYNITSKQGHEFFLEDIPEGKLISYILASACFPGLQPEVIDGNQFVDGGFHNNMPVNMAIQKGYKDIIAVRTVSPGIIKKTKGHNTDIITIEPSEPLGPLMIFNSTTIIHNIQLGYCDAMRKLRGLKGRRYYVTPRGEKFAFKMLSKVSEKKVAEMSEILGIKHTTGKRALFEKIVPELASHFKLPKEFDYEDFILLLVEEAAEKKEIERLNLVTFEALSGCLLDEDNCGLIAKPRQILKQIEMPPTKYKKAAEILLKEILGK